MHSSRCWDACRCAALTFQETAKIRLDDYPYRLRNTLSSHRQAANQLSGNDLSEAGEEGLGVWAGRYVEVVGDMEVT